MPTYEYRCTECDHSFEVIQKITDSPIAECERCGGPVRKVLFPVGILFKGPGFHINDYRKSSPSSDGGDGPKEPTKPKKDTVTAN